VSWHIRWVQIDRPSTFGARCGLDEANALLFAVYTLSNQPWTLRSEIAAPLGSATGAPQVSMAIAY
jgi:hypothetical protein